MRHPLMPDLFETTAHADDPGRFPWVAAAAAAIVIGAAMLLVAAQEDSNSSAPQVTVVR